MQPLRLLLVLLLLLPVAAFAESRTSNRRSGCIGTLRKWNTRQL